MCKLSVDINTYINDPDLFFHLCTCTSDRIIDKTSYQQKLIFVPWNEALSAWGNTFSNFCAQKFGKNKIYKENISVRHHGSDTYSSDLTSKSIGGQMKTQWQSKRYRLVRVCAVAIPLCLDTQSSLTRHIVILISHGNVAMNFIYREYMIDIRVLPFWRYSLFLSRIIFEFAVTVIFKKSSSSYYSISSVFYFFNFDNFANFLSCRWSKFYH